ncbi:MAG: MFS transporter [Anaerolineaceae bacterium]|nr:MFS transporter [Anaerolineaceae bacterium]
MNPDTPNGKIALTISYYATFVCLGLSAAVFGPTLPSLAEGVNVNLDAISILFTAGSLGYLIGSSQGGRLYDHFGGNRVMAGMLMALCILLFLMPVMPSLLLLAAVMVLADVAKGAIDSGGNILLVWVHGGEVAPFMNALHFFYGVGAFITPVIVAQVVNLSGNIQWVYSILALLMLPAAIFLLRLPNPEIRKEPPEQIAHKTNYKLIALIAVLLFLYVGGEISFGGWIFTYTKELGLGSTSTAAYLTSAFWLSFTIGRLLSIPLTRRFKPFSIVFSSLVGSLISLLVILIIKDSLIAVWVGTFGFGLSMAAIFPMMITLAENRVALTGKIMGWIFAGASMGGMFLPWFIGQLFETVGPRVMMFAITINMVVALAVFMPIMRTPKTSGVMVE